MENEKTSLTVSKETRELVSQVKRKISFEEDKDYSVDETIGSMCKKYLEPERGTAPPEDEGSEEDSEEE